VVFEGGYEKVCSAGALRSGSVKNPYYPSVHGVGFLGVGEHITSKNKILTKESIVWRGMLQRCYDEKFLIRHPSYTDNFVNPSFHNFQIFAEWCQSAVGFGNDRWQLDKDIIYKGNKEYSPEACCFIPAQINNLIINNKSCRGSLPIGVSFHKEKRKFTASCQNGAGRQEELGTFNTPEEAFSVYKERKESTIKDVANTWKGVIDPRVYSSLLSWTIDIGD
jgi:hypothetical protein